MLRTSLRSSTNRNPPRSSRFLSSNAQDFIEDLPRIPFTVPQNPFLSSNAQDFIEEERNNTIGVVGSAIPEQ